MSMNSGFVHYGGTLSDALCFAYQLEYAEVILCGVDLYVRRYFFVKYDEIRDIDLESGAKNTSIHNTREGFLNFSSYGFLCLHKKMCNLHIES